MGQRRVHGHTTHTRHTHAHAHAHAHALSLILDFGDCSGISPVNAGSHGFSLHAVFLWCSWHVWDAQGVHGHEFIMSQISKLVDSHGQLCSPLACSTLCWLILAKLAAK